MKKIFFLVLVMAFVYAGNLLAQTPPHPNEGNPPGSGNTPVGGGAPIAGGLVILFSLATGYAAKRIYDMRSRLSE